MKTLLIDNAVFFREVMEQIHAGERVRIRAKGNSMLPLIRSGSDEITLQPLTPQSLRKGAIVLARLKNGTYVVHRIAKLHRKVVWLRGDGNPYAQERCTTDDLLAEAVEIGRNGKSVTPTSLRWKMVRYLWPTNRFLRRLLLAIYRRTAAGDFSLIS